jgi:hypothetical protein
MAPRQDGRYQVCALAVNRAITGRMQKSIVAALLFVSPVTA